MTSNPALLAAPVHGLVMRFTLESLTDAHQIGVLAISGAIREYIRTIVFEASVDSWPIGRFESFLGVAGSVMTSDSL